MRSVQQVVRKPVKRSKDSQKKDKTAKPRSSKKKALDDDSKPKETTTTTNETQPAEKGEEDEGDHYSTAEEGKEEEEEEQEQEKVLKHVVKEPEVEVPKEHAVASTAAETQATSSDGDEDNLWTIEQASDLANGNRLGAQRRVHRLISGYFRADRDSGELVFLDDGVSKLRGSDVRRIVNFLVPMKNIHPKQKPNGIAPILDILRLRRLEPTLFPNENVSLLLQELGNKPTAYTDRIRKLDVQRLEIKRIADGLKFGEHDEKREPADSETKAPPVSHWETFH